MLAVALTTLNRVDDEAFGSTICEVVYQPGQFSWTKEYTKVKYNSEAWLKAQAAAVTAFYDRTILGKFTATHFHNNTVDPKWSLRKVATIGNHTFYTKK